MLVRWRRRPILPNSPANRSRSQIAWALPIIAKTGYDPYAQADLLASLGRYEKFVALHTGGNRGQNFLSDFFASHPNSEKRVKEAAVFATRFRTGKNRQNRFVVNYLTQIDGMVYGQSGENGFVSGDKFIHPKLQIMFAIPSGWEVQNTPDAVMLSGLGAEKIRFDAVRLAKQEMAGTLATRWAKKLRLKTSSTARQLVLGGNPAAVLAGYRRDQNGKVEYVRVYSILFGKNRAYRFLMRAPARKRECCGFGFFVARRIVLVR